MDAEQPAFVMLEPPLASPEYRRSDWFPVPDDDPVADYVTQELWDRTLPPAAWEAARLSAAAYLYREQATQWTLVAKFYSQKVRTVDSAQRYSTNEFIRTQQAHTLLPDAAMRAPRPLGCHRGALFLEYVDGLTLEDLIAIRRHRPGTLPPSLVKTGQLLCALHRRAQQPEAERAFRYEVSDIQEYVQQLAEHGVLEGNQLVVDGLLRLVDRWAADPAMIDYMPTLVHGDATTSNFVFDWDGGLAAIDWERMWTADPATDLGRLMAEVSRGVHQQGGDADEVERLLGVTIEAYCEALPSGWDVQAMQRRAQFYRASSTLRIARNGWLPRLERTALVTEALALLAHGT